MKGESYVTKTMSMEEMLEYIKQYDGMVFKNIKTGEINKHTETYNKIWALLEKFGFKLVRLQRNVVKFRYQLENYDFIDVTMLARLEEVGLRSKFSTLFFIYSEINYERRARLMSKIYLPENLKEVLIGKRIIGVEHYHDVDDNTFIYIIADDGTQVELKAIIQRNTEDGPQGTMIQVRGTIVNEVEFTIIGDHTEE